MRKTNQNGIDHIKRWEGLKTTAYRDQAGVLTIGYGHTSSAGSPMVTSGMKISEAEAEEILKKDLRIFEERVSRLVKVDLTDNQFAALVSFDFNTGALHSSTLLKKLNRGDYESVPSELMKWVKVTVDGKKMTSKGLVNRRASEAGLWSRGEFVSSRDVVAKAETKPVMTRENVSWGVGILSSLGLAGAGDGPIQYALAGCLVIAFSVALFLFVKKRLSE